MSSLPYITITHSNSGASAQVHPCGATVCSFKTSSQRELLFLSREAKLDGTKAIRGGIPLVFPQFGQPDKSYPQHGFLRDNIWEVDECSKYDNDDAAGLDFVLTLDKVVKSRGGVWDVGTDLDCKVILSVKIEPSQMTNVLTISNTSGLDIHFQTLFHTYFKVHGSQALDNRSCNVTGLEGYAVSDKITNEDYTLGSDPVPIDGNVDRVYTPPMGKNIVDLVIATGEGTKVQLTASGTVNGNNVVVSAVVWNPHKEKAKEMSDFGDNEYFDMICVEPGILSYHPTLFGSNDCVFTQIIKEL
jgi:glucose-6-phosphate 1-epimerase